MPASTPEIEMYDELALLWDYDLKKWTSNVEWEKKWKQSFKIWHRIFEKDVIKLLKELKEECIFVFDGTDESERTGGKDFIVAHKTANAKQVATAISRGAFEFQGQKCSAASRAYIPNNIWKDVKNYIIEDINSFKNIETIR